MTATETTATVTALTAEVRVLMVGSRQITLSVARQLDYAAFGDMEPMGRCRIAPEVTHLIGRHLVTGALVVCQMPWEVSFPPRLPRPLARAITLCKRLSHQGVGRGVYSFESPVGAVGFAEDDRVRCAYDHWYQGQCDPLMSASPETWGQVEALVRRHEQGQAAYNARIEAAQELPLIVLAGLR